MEERRKHSGTSMYDLTVRFLSARSTRIIFFIILMLGATAFMFLVDESNEIRNQYLPFLNNNFFKDFMAFFGIKTFPIQLVTWYIFLTALGVSYIFMIAYIFAPPFIKARVDHNRSKFRDEIGARRFYAFWYYFIIFLFCAAIVFVLYMMGIYKTEFDPEYPILSFQFLNLLYALILFVVLVSLIPIALVIVYFIIKFVFFIIAWLIHLLRMFVFDIEHKEQEVKVTNTLQGGGGGDNGPKKVEAEVTFAPTDITEKDLFPVLTAIDQQAEESPAEEIPAVNMTLDQIALQFQSYAINKHKIYYELPLIRTYIAGMACSRLIVLEGLSGTGKSMLPRMFSYFTGADIFFAPVQSTWRDKTDVLGFYSEFTNTYRSTDFLNRLYEAGYSKSTNLMVLDEMNLSRVEYYFADFLSVLEFPQEDWRVKMIDSNVTAKLPKNLTDGYVKIPANTWFIGTANTDDSTFAITEKVCDRAVLINFEDKILPITSNYASDPIKLGADELQKLFDEAMASRENCLSDAELEKFGKVCEFIRDKFDIVFGNRIMVQIEKFVPVFVALGGTKEQAIDIMLESKILRKLDLVFDDYLKENLIALKKEISTVYGSGVLVETEKLIAKKLKRLG